MSYRARSTRGGFTDEDGGIGAFGFCDFVA